MLSFKSVKTKIATLSGLCVLCTVVLLTGWSLVSARNTEAFVTTASDQLLDKSARDYLTEVAGLQASALRLEFRTALDIARDQASAFAVLAGGAAATPPDARRVQINEILAANLNREPRLNGTYTAWEPNALDGQDAALKGRRETGTDDTGRFLPYWNRDKTGHVAMQTLVEYDSRELHPNGVMKGGWYIGPQETGRESVLDPLPYVVQGKQVWLATLSVPIVIDGRFRGVAGADFDLDFVQQLATDVAGRIFGGKDSVTIISNMGLVVASSAHPDLIGKSYQGQSADWTADLATVKAGRATVDLDQGHGTLRAFLADYAWLDREAVECPGRGAAGRGVGRGHRTRHPGDPTQRQRGLLARRGWPRGDPGRSRRDVAVGWRHRAASDRLRGFRPWHRAGPDGSDTDRGSTKTKSAHWPPRSIRWSKTWRRHGRSGRKPRPEPRPNNAR